MLRYQYAIIAFIVIIITVLAADTFISIPILTYPVFTLILIGILSWGSIRVQSGFYCRTYCSGEAGIKKIALTFDDGPDKEITPVVLSILKEKGIQATFFCIGEKASKNPDIVRDIDLAGHTIGNHSFTHHFFFDLFSSGKMLAELQKTDNVIHDIISKKIRMFRPPYGVTNPSLAGAIKKLDYYVTGWSLRSKDTVITDEDILLNRLKKNLKGGDIILFHDTLAHTPEVLNKFIRFAMENGYRFERSDRLLKIEPYEIPHTS